MVDELKKPAQHIDLLPDLIPVLGMVPHHDPGAGTGPENLFQCLFNALVHVETPSSTGI
jgi:hypothetical protein